MRLLVVVDISGIGAFVVIQVGGGLFASGERFGSVVLGMSVILSTSVVLGIGLGLACRVKLDGVGGVGGVVLLDINGACWLLNLSIGGLIHCTR